MSDYASLCFLSYNRPQFIFDAIGTAKDNADYPCEVIVHDDGSTSDQLLHELWQLLDRGGISRLILNTPGNNEGVGTAFNRCAAVATGDPIVKLDQDLLFEPGWLRRVASLLDGDHRVAATGLFKYSFDPVDWRKMEMGAGPCHGHDYHYVQDFVGSGIAIPRRAWRDLGQFPEHSDAFAEDVEWKRNAQGVGYELALFDRDVARNVGFGPGPSTVVYMAEDGVRVSEIKHGTTVFG